jgi:hypothetical protein
MLREHEGKERERKNLVSGWRKWIKLWRTECETVRRLGMDLWKALC